MSDTQTNTTDRTYAGNRRLTDIRNWSSGTENPYSPVLSIGLLLLVGVAVKFIH
ncbi:hypothetical protein JQ604_34905 [Bradyrhizobium jicamae]|uniref:hypothetical protein n=1 Tax=Bradyrhizobium jicamae TaxID=280332 RepID=UPI001BA9FFD9|nr:hypothetical protein [Bradyrhizobium jicamae]MBR0757400.1 hypothetical protein [Bradyrhizobium jicamae]